MSKEKEKPSSYIHHAMPKLTSGEVTRLLNKNSKSEVKLKNLPDKHK
jgi:hypothetical protein